MQSQFIKTTSCCSERDTTFIDKVLPFGLRSAPKILAIANAVQWVMVKRGIRKSFHYLDDYILVTGHKEEALHQKQLLISVFNYLGVPLEESKLEGPATCLTYLGIEVDTVTQQLHLPVVKLERLDSELQEAVERKSMFKKV